MIAKKFVGETDVWQSMIVANIAERIFWYFTKVLQKKRNTKTWSNCPRSSCVSLLRETKIPFFGKVNHKVVSDNRKFWKTADSLFLVRTLPTESIILNKTISNIKDVKEVSWMSHNVSFCLFFFFFCKIGTLERNTY